MGIRPNTLDDLGQHVCIRNIYPSGKPYTWNFTRAGKIIEFEPSGFLSLDDHELMVEAALAVSFPCRASLSLSARTIHPASCRRGSNAVMR
ncbi:hypothetical protein ACQZ6F_29035 [Rhizobium sp. A22-96]